MTGIFLEPKVMATAAGSSVGASSSVADEQIGFAAILANLSHHGGAQEDDAGQLRGLLAALVAAIGSPGQPNETVDGVDDFLGRDGIEARPAATHRDLASIFNEFGLLGSPAAAAPVKAAATPSDAERHAMPAAAQASVAGPGQRYLDIADTTYWGGPDQEYLETPRTAHAEASSNRGRTESPAMATPMPVAPAIAALPAPSPEPGEPVEQQSVDDGGAPSLPNPTSGGDIGPRLNLTVAEHAASLVARLERLSRDERLRLRHEVERLLTAHGLIPNEIRVNGAIDNDRST